MSKIFLGDAPNLPLFTGENGQVGVKEAAAALEALGLPYEVGTWEPELGYLSATKEPEFTFTNTNNIFCKIGRLVNVLFESTVTITDEGTGSRALIKNLPFAINGMSINRYGITQQILSQEDAFRVTGNRCVTEFAGWKVCSGINVTILIMGLAAN